MEFPDSMGQTWNLLTIDFNLDLSSKWLIEDKYSVKRYDTGKHKYKASQESHD